MAFHGQQYTLPVYGYHAWWRTADATADVRVPPPRGEAAAVAAAARTSGCSRRRTTTSTSRRSSAAYPDARFVMTHRDPAKSVPSWASLVSTIFPDAADRARPAPARPRGVEPPPRRCGAGHRGPRAHRRGPLPRRAPPRADRRPDGHGAPRLRLPRARAHARRSSRRSRDWQVGQPVRRARHAPLHRRAVRPQRRRSCAPTTTSTSDHFDIDDSKGPTTWSDDGIRDRCPPGPTRCARSSRSVDNLLADVAPRRRHRGRGPGHEQARAVDPRRAATCAASTPTRAARCSCRCGTTRSTRAVPTPTTCTRRPRSTRTASTGSPASAARRASSRSPAAGLRHDEPGR